VVLVIDSAGIGALPDAADYGDAGAATWQNTAEAVGGLRCPHLERLGLGRVAPIRGLSAAPAPTGFAGKLAEVSPGKDTTTGHWELMGVELARAFSVFPQGFPAEIVEPFVARTGRGVLGNKAALFPYTQPALFAMPVAFLLAYIFSKTDASVRAGKEIEAFDDQYVRAQTGYGAAGAASH